MTPLQIIPVIDLKQGLVVRAVAGQRELYRPIESVLDCDAQPESVARALVHQLGFRLAYVADLDAIAGADPDFDCYARIMQAGLELWLDAGIGTPQQAGKLADASIDGRPLTGIVVGLESLATLDALDDLLVRIGAERAIFSLDLRGGQPIARAPLATLTPQQIAAAVHNTGFRKLIVLDLAHVGTDSGPKTATLCQELARAHAWQLLISGGGIRNLEDVETLNQAGCDAVLVASALHSGELKIGTISD